MKLHWFSSVFIPLLVWIARTQALGIRLRKFFMNLDNMWYSWSGFWTSVVEEDIYKKISVGRHNRQLKLAVETKVAKNGPAIQWRCYKDRDQILITAVTFPCSNTGAIMPETWKVWAFDPKWMHMGIEKQGLHDLSQGRIFCVGWHLLIRCVCWSNNTDRNIERSNVFVEATMPSVIVVVWM